MAALRALVEPGKGKLRGVTARAEFDAIIRGTAAPEGVTFREDQVGGIPGWWCEPTGALADAALLHFHGGWFNWGSAAAYRHLVGHFARAARANAFIPDYRLAPEQPFPAALQDARASFRGLVKRGIRALAVSGDSAGGNLALSVLAGVARSPDYGVRPVGAVVHSPVTDLAMTGASWHSRADADPFFVPGQVKALIDAYLNGAEATDPDASPLYGNFVGLPPIRAHVGEDEVLLDDTLRYIERAVTAGVDARAHVWEGMPHGFVTGVGRLEAADKVLTEIGAFLKARLSTAAERPD